jgi:hypothetical protein
VALAKLRLQLNELKDAMDQAVIDQVKIKNEFLILKP